MAVKKTEAKEPVVEVVKTEEKKEFKKVAEEPTVEVGVKEPVLEVNKEPVVEVTPVESKVKIRMAQNHRCYIGGEFYGLEKGECYNVPQNVKEVLNRAGLLAPL